MLMGEKKDRGRFSIKFNENDPAHEEVIRLLECQKPHSKAQFIANAVLHYVRCPQARDMPAGAAAATDKASIEAIVLEILSRREKDKEDVYYQDVETGRERRKGHMQTRQAEPLQEKHKERTSEEAVPDTAPEDSEQHMDQDTMELIRDAMSAFRND